MMQNKDLGAVFTELKKDLTAFLTVKLDILKIDIYQKSSTISSMIIFGLIILLVVFFACLFLFLALGLYLGEILGSFGLGTLIIALIYFLFFGILLWKRKSVLNFLVNLFIEQLIEDEGEENGNA